MRQRRQDGDPKQGWQQHTWRAVRVINCTGPDLDYTRVSSELLSSLFAQGEIMAGPMGQGLWSNAHGALRARNGEYSKILFNVGPGRQGMLLESIAVPELRQQALELAEFLSGELERFISERERLPAIPSTRNVREHAQVAGKHKCTDMKPGDTHGNHQNQADSRHRKIQGIVNDRPGSELHVKPDPNLRRETVVAPAELLTEVLIPKPAVGARSAYQKYSEKENFDWPIADAGVLLEVDGIICKRATIALGAASPNPRRAVEAEAVLAGKKIETPSVTILVTRPVSRRAAT